MTTLHATFIHIKHYFLDLGLVLGVSVFTNFWHAISDELNIVLVAHSIVLLIVSVLLKIVVRWIGEEIEVLSDIDYMRNFECERNVFELLKQPETHGKMYKENKDSMVFDHNKIKICSNFMGIKTVEIFEVQDKGDTVVLKNISGKYESSVTYEFEGSGIIAHWVAKPKGLRRAIGLLFSNLVIKNLVKDFQSFIDKNKI